MRSDCDFANQILWDEWGVPHIFARDDNDLGFAFGWAQMRAHPAAMLRVYGEARGRAAEYWGEQYLNSDRLIRSMDIPDQGVAGYEAQSAEFRRYLEAFAAGANAFAKEHPESIDPESSRVLPVTACDLLAHAHRLFFVLHARAAAGPSLVGTDGYPSPALGGTQQVQQAAGSNAWAIAPHRAVNRRALLLMNLHLPWFIPIFTLFESQLIAPGIDFYGVTLVGLPVPISGFNDDLGWAHTVNTFHALDLYVLKLADDGYVYENALRSFKTETQTLSIREPEGKMRQETLMLRRSIHGPVITLDGRAIAVRTPAERQHGALQQWWDMSRARNLQDFESILQRLELTMLTVIYADREGHILQLFGGRMPKRPVADAKTWASPVAGDTAAMLWSDTHPYPDLPRVVNPECGWLQNSNCPPWRTATPPLRKADFPDYMAPDFVSAREQSAVHMLSSEACLSFEDVVRCRYSTRVGLADLVLDDLIEAARASQSPSGDVLAKLLSEWDRNADAHSRGALLFAIWAAEMFPDSLATADAFAVPWTPGDPFGTPSGLADPQRALAVLKRSAAMMSVAGFEGIDAAWGGVMRLRINGQDFPGNGGTGDPLGLFHVVEYTQRQAALFEAIGGDAFAAVIEFSDPVRAEALLPCGNSSDRTSRHRGDQLELLSRKQMRPVWRSLEEITAHLELREVRVDEPSGTFEVSAGN